MNIGEHIRRIRKQKSLTIRDVAERARLTKSLISQVENDKANPSLKSLMAIAGALGVTIGSFFEEESPPARPVVRRRERPLIRTQDGITFYLLTPDLKNKPSEFLYCVYEPGATTSPLHTHTGMECGLVLEGRFEVVVGEERHVLGRGDSIVFDSTRPHYATNIHSGRGVTIWVNTPPTF